MSDNMILYVAIAVFTLLLIGVVLTILEFSRGEPHKQEEEARRNPTTDASNQPL